MKNNVTIFDEIVTKKVMKICQENKITKYLDVASMLMVSESFIKKVFTGRSKFNLSHLYRLSIHLNTSINEFIPNNCDVKDYYNIENISEENLFSYKLKICNKGDKKYDFY